MANSGLQPAVIAITFLFPALSLSIVIVRFWRKSVARTLAGDDALLAIAMLFSIAYTFTSYAYIKANYYGYRLEDIPKGAIDKVKVAKIQYAYAILYNPILCLVKASFLLSLQNLDSPRIWLNRSLWAIQIINLLYMIGAVTASILACIPIRKKFYPNIPGHCYDTGTYVVASICVVIATDIMVLMMPTWLIYDLKMPRARKMITISFLSFGIAVTAIGIARLHYLIQQFMYGINFNHSVNQTYSAIESNLAIIGACGPIVKWILSQCIPFLRSDDRWREDGTTPPTGSSVSSRRRRRWMEHFNDGVTMQEDDYVFMSKGNDRYELKGKARRKERTNANADARSDEQRIIGDDQGIVKEMGWTVESGDRVKEPRNGSLRLRDDI